MFLAKMSINRPVMTTMIILVFLIFGGIAYFGMNLNQMPDVEIPYITIQTVYPGAGPKEIETQISKKIEDAVATVSEIEQLLSYSLDGASVVIIQFKMTKDVNVANQEVKDKVDAIINDLPTDAEKPIVEKVDFRAFPIMQVVLSGDIDPRELYDIADKTLKDRFSQIQGVARVDATGGQEREIQVVMNNRVAFENSISLPQMLQLLAYQNRDIPGGYFQIGDQEYTVRLDGEFPDTKAIEELRVPTAFGPKKIKQFATVVDGGKKIRQRAVYFNVKNKFRDENVVRLGIVKSTDGNVVKVAEAVRATLPDIEKTLPAGCKLEIISDNSVFTRSTVDDTMSNVLLGVIFTSIVLLLFLANFRSTLIVALSMPTSIISTFMLMSAAGLTMNMMTLMGLSVSIGVLVANSVVVLENIFRHRNMGKMPKEAAYIGTKEVTVAVLASTMTNLVVFLPIANMSSLVGQFMKELALTAVFATIFSIFMSFTLTPMLASLILPKTAKVGRIGAAFDAFYRKWDDFYRKILTVSLKNWIISLGILIVTGIILVGSLMIYGPHLGFEFIPASDNGKLMVEVELPQGYNLKETSNSIKEIEEKLSKHEEVIDILTTLGKKSDMDIGTNMALININLVDAKEREIGLGKLIDVFTEDLAKIPNMNITVKRADNEGPGQNPVEFFILGQDLEEVEVLKEQTMEAIKDVPGLINLDNSSRAGKPEITVYPKRDKLSESGLTVFDIAMTLRSAIEGIESTKYRELGNEYDIIVTLDDESTNTPEKIGNIPLVGPGGTYRLSQVADVKFTTGFTKIIHRDKYIAIQITGGNAEGVPIGDVTAAIDKKMADIEFPPGYRYEWGGNTKMMNEMILDMGFAFFIAVILTYMLLAAILESFFQPIIILSTLPLAFIGAVTSLYYTNIALGITALMAIIMLIGIVVNNAILMLDYTNQLVRDEGMKMKDALIQACPTKLKPIMMSTLALILGMLPMALGIGDAGAEMRQPMGVVSIGGLVSSTLLTLVVIPASVYIFDLLWNMIKRMLGIGRKTQMKI